MDGKRGMRVRSLISVGFLCLGVGGCALAGLGGGESAPATFNIATPQITGVPSSRLASQVTVHLPSAIRALDTDRILVTAPGGRISYFAGAAWGDRLPKLLQSRLVEAMQSSGAFRAVLTNQDRVDGEFAVTTEIRAFQLEVDNGSTAAVVGVFAKIMDERRGRVIATREFSARTPANKDDSAAGVAALQESFNQVTSNLVRWVAAPRGGNSGA